MGYNPNEVDVEGLDEQDAIIERERQQAAAYQQEEALKRQAAEEEEKSGPEKLADVTTGVLKEVNDARLNNPINVGIAKGLNGIFTTPQRMYDIATGEVERQEEGGGEYSPSWDPFREFIDENKPKNWWESGTQIAFEAATQIGAAATVSPSSLVGRLAIGAPLEATFSADIGTNKQKLFISDNVPWLKDQFNDSPQSKTLKAILENMAYEGTGELIGTLWGKWMRGPDATDIEVQRAEKAKVEYNEDRLLEGQRALPEGIDKVEVKDITDEVAPPSTFRGHKNTDMADPGQGTVNSRSSTEVQFSNRKWQVRDGEDIGTAGYNFTPAQAERMSNQNGIPQEWMDQKAQELYSSAYYKQVVGETKAAKNSWYEANKEIFAEFQETMGRFDSTVDPEEFWKRQFDRVANTGGSKGEGYWAANDVLVADLVNAELFQAIRNRGMAALELGEKFDLMDTDSSMHKISQYLTMGLAQVRRSRYMMSDQFRALGNKQGKIDLKEKMAQFTEESRESIEGFMTYIKDQPTDDAAKAAAEMFAKSDINSYGDIGAYLNSKFRRGDYGKYGKGQSSFMSELNRLTMLSQLSSPKTLFKAFKGTVEMGGERMIGQALGGVLNEVMGGFQGNGMKIAREAVAGMSFLKEVPSDFMRVFQKNLDAWWNKDIAKLGNRYSGKFDPEREAMFDMWYDYQMKNAGLVGKAHAKTVWGMRAMAKWQGLSYPFAAMSTIDEMAGVVMAKNRAAQLAMREQLVNKKWYEPINKADYKAAKDNFLNATMDANGNIDFEQDMFLKAGYEEITLTRDLENIFGSMDKLVAKHPELGVAYRYMTTGVNNLAYQYKKLPVLGALHKEYFAIQKAMKTGDLASVSKYGIENVDDLRTAKAIWDGRQALGMMTVGILLQKKLNNELTGNGTLDYGMNEVWKDAGWKPRTMRFGDLEVSLEGFDTFNTIAYMISDIVDNGKLMGEKWQDSNLATLAFAVGIAGTSKSMLSGLNNFVKLASGDERAAGKLAGDLINSVIPSGGLRNTLGKMLKPGLLELNGNMWDAIRNRNRMFEGLYGDDQLQAKADVLYGDKLTPWDYVVNAINANSPIELNWRTERPGRDLLIASGYNQRLLTYSYGGLNLTEERTVRAKFRDALSTQGLGKKLDRLAENPKIIASLDKMGEDRENGIPIDDPMKSYYHLKIIHSTIEQAKRKAWAEISGDADVQALMQKNKEAKQLEASTLRTTRAQTDALLNWNNK